MFDVKKPEMTNKTFRMPQDLVSALQEVAQAKGVSLNNLVIQCCEYALENLKKDNDTISVKINNATDNIKRK
jgi:exosome complex RNA-binding protein Csl4